jgi:MOSC domain-containing protein YiiM
MDSPHNSPLQRSEFAPHVLSINTGIVQPLFVNTEAVAQSVMSAIRKAPLSGRVTVNRLGIAGDERADMSVHGGLDKAVYLYPHEHYAFWVTARERVLHRQESLSYGFMGENLTTEGLLETELWVGDRLEIGELVLEVTEPRAPCFKFAARMGYPQAIKHMLQSGLTGVYLKVITPADITVGQTICIKPGSREVSIADINRQRLKGRQRDLFP